MTEAHDQPAAPSAALFDGPLDLVGDVHGELAALQRLLAQLGYDRHGEHPQGRRVVFVGDLCDRGPDSPAVIALAQRLIDRQLAQCVLGNHEINLLRHERKRGNGWYFDDHPDHRLAEFANCRSVGERERDTIRTFLSRLPLVLTRADLRVVHAAWHVDSLQRIARQPPRSVLDSYREYEAEAQASIPAEVAAASRREQAQWRAHLHDRGTSVPLLANLAEEDTRYQMGNPLRVLTSGSESPAERSAYVGGKWRMVSRTPWWQDYSDDTPVVIGHYWRWINERGRSRYGGMYDLFGALAPGQWLGPRRSVFCVDFSVGARFREQLDGFAPGELTRLAALRWPEAELIDEFGHRTEAWPGASARALQAQ